MRIETNSSEYKFKYNISMSALSYMWLDKMATGVGWKYDKGYKGYKYNIRRFAYDLLHITLSKCGFPEIEMQVSAGKENNYRDSDYVSTVHSAVLDIAFFARDKWKRMFDYKQKSNVLSDMEKVEKYLTNIEVLPEFRMTDDMDKIRRSLAFYSELTLFLHSNNIKVDFEKLLDLWTSYFYEKIALKEDPDVLLEAIFIEDPEIVGYLSLVDTFIKDVAKPYGKTADFSEKFLEFSRKVELFYKGKLKEPTQLPLAKVKKSLSCPPISEKDHVLLGHLPEPSGTNPVLPGHLAEPPGTNPVLPGHLPEPARTNPVLPGNLPQPPKYKHGFSEPSPKKKFNVVFTERNFGIKKKPQPGKFIPMIVSKPHDSPETSNEIATGGVWRINKGYKGQKYNIKRFGYDILFLALSKCGFPKTKLQVEVDKENEYRHYDYVVTVYSGVITIAFLMRDKWKHMFDYKQKSNVLSDMEKVEKYLTNIEVLPEFRMTDDMDKIRRSLAFYSELILFLYSNNIEVDFGKLLDIWSNYFNEKIAVKEDSDVLLEAIFIEDPSISAYLGLVHCFIQEYAIPYGQKYISDTFQIFCFEVEKFYKRIDNRLLEILGDSFSKFMEYTPRHFVNRGIYQFIFRNPSISAIEEDEDFSSTEEVEQKFERMNIGSDIKIKETEVEDESLPENRYSPEPVEQRDFPLPSSSTRMEEKRAEGIDIGCSMATKETEKDCPGNRSSPESVEQHDFHLPSSSMREAEVRSEGKNADRDLSGDETSKG